MSYFLAGIFCLVIAIVFVYLNGRITVATIISILLAIFAMYRGFSLRKGQ